MRSSAILASLIIFFSGSIFAASSDAIQLDVTRPDFIHQKDNILKVVNNDVAYGEISAEDRVIVNKSLSNISDQLKDGKTFSTLSVEQQQLILAEQKNLNEALSQARKDSKMICKREPVLGSNMLKKVCRTAAAERKENDRIRDQNTNFKVE